MCKQVPVSTPVEKEVEICVSTPVEVFISRKLVELCEWSVVLFVQLICLISWFIWLVDVFDQLISWCIWSVDLFDWLMCLIFWFVWSDDVFDQLMCLIDWCICILWIDVFGWLISLISRSCKIYKQDVRFKISLHFSGLWTRGAESSQDHLWKTKALKSW